MKRSSPLKAITVSAIMLVISAVFVAGMITTAEIVYRAAGGISDRARLIDLVLFPYSPYVVSTQPAGLTLGGGGHLLDEFFEHSRCDGAGGVTLRLNSTGFRSPEFPQPGSKSADELRIVLTGSSAAASWKIGEACTLDRALRAALERLLPGRRITVLNLSSAGWKSFQELIAVEHFGLRLDPDVVIHFSGFNDTFHAQFMPIDRAYSEGRVREAFDDYAEWQKGAPGQFLRQLHVVRAIRSMVSPAPVALNRPEANAAAAPAVATDPGPGRVATALSLPLDLGAVAARTDFDPFNRRVVDNYVRNERLMARALTTVGASLLSVLQPTLYLKRPFGPAEARLMRSSYATSANFTVQAYLRLRQGLAGLQRSEANLRFLDASAPFDGNAADVFTDNVHFSAEGYRVVAKSLAAAIGDIIGGKTLSAPR